MAFRRSICSTLIKLLLGLDPNDKKEARMYWQVQLGYCECVLGGYSDSKEAMANLSSHILRLRKGAQAMGGRYGRFNRIETRAKRLSEE